MFLRKYFLFFGLLDLTALLIALYLSLDVIAIYFSYFTVLSNYFITFIFLCFGLNFNPKYTKNLSFIYGAAVLYMSITGIIFWSILRNNHLQTVPWINIVLHGVMPLAAFLGWILYPPPKLKYRDALNWLWFPLVFVAFTLIRGPFVNWYPYPFLNPETMGYVRVFLNVGALLIGAYLLGIFLIFISKKEINI